ncbi:MAG: outer membrane protein transport protein, partial [Desulfobacterales bacterium]|nr:outer membrane protein transport protein [Desulfobacterales bacterium]
MMVKRFVVTIVAVCATAHMAYAGCVDTYGIGSRATALGGAYAATADDPFAAYYNPAGLSQIEGKMMATGVHVIEPTIEISGFEVVGGNFAKDPEDFELDSKILVAPHLGYAQKLNDRFAFALSVYAPWGLELEWEDEPTKNYGAYNTYESYYKRFGVTPALSYQVTDNLSVGVGVTIGRSDAGASGHKIVDGDGNSINGISKHPSGAIVSADIETEMTDDFNYSYNVGVMYKIRETVTLGLTYRSECDAEFEGDGDITTPTGVVYSGDISMDYNHPQQVQAGVRYQPHDRFSVECDVVWTDWSIGDSQVVALDKTLQAVAKVPALDFARDWEDTKQLRFGAEYMVNDLLTIRAGYFYDPTPIPDDTLDLQWPDADKKVYSIGAGFNFGSFTVDAVFQYTDIEK